MDAHKRLKAQRLLQPVSLPRSERGFNHRGSEHDAVCDGLTRGGRAFSVKSRIAGTSGFVDHVFLVLTTQL